MDLYAKVRANLLERELARPGEALLLAVSGGLDSMVLLHVLSRLTPESDLRLSVAHFNHGLRGAESDGDEAFVRAAAGRLGLMFIGGAGDVHGCAVRQRVSIEMAARELRHEFLARASRSAGAKKVVLAHHADDQVETFWLRMLRGQAGPGLAGMRWSAPSPADPEVRLIRPFLNVARCEIAEFARLRAVAWREDSSNARTEIQRNQLRLEVLPALERFQPKLREITLRAIEVLAAEKEFLREAAAAQENFESAHPAVQRERLRQMLARAGVEATFELIETLRKSTAPIMVGPGLLAAREEGGRIALRTVERVSFDPAERVLDLRRGGAAEWHGARIEWQIEDRAAMLEARKGLEQFDADLVGPKITLRHWRAGDRFQPIGIGQPVKLQDLFSNLKVPEAERHCRIVAARGSGEIFWVEGLRIGEIAKLGPATQRVLRWRCERQEGRGLGRNDVTES